MGLVFIFILLRIIIKLSGFSWGLVKLQEKNIYHIFPIREVLLFSESCQIFGLIACKVDYKFFVRTYFLCTTSIFGKGNGNISVEKMVK